MKSIEDLITDQKITRKLKKKLSPKRYEHTLNVTKVAYELGRSHHYSPNKAALAGLLHDCAKHYSNKKLLGLCERYHISKSKAEEANGDLLHAKVGAFIAKEKYHIEDPDIFNAITYHTTGRPSMSLLEKIVYISDYIEPGRKHGGRLDLIRRIAYQDLDQAMLYILEDSLEYLYHKKVTIDPLTKETYNYYKKLRRE
ncbi:bis(5'-nucleosyl)-tetraphosphatase (symmetrical) YqeK [Petrocella sp. FN5]|uniref:bis(5'-nucleosyl)-tetraphosphatase (symmetrical) YqeK n=1 Tax=Petrocella sp. FN5 TaxID=3032002 RepID=UPI0023DC850D|nr:bis(5'-nucleosyl)-tetraphosphatase (symmetrical) YqeK [Petrocella sp. FN5]MDF1617961.1 bis(5'-nucleosyl)-tetraphosphatase (symmetrical) YqeK [Petrocella sp. FN5]